MSYRPLAKLAAAAVIMSSGTLAAAAKPAASVAPGTKSSKSVANDCCHKGMAMAQAHAGGTPEGYECQPRKADTEQGASELTVEKLQTRQTDNASGSKASNERVALGEGAIR